MGPEQERCGESGQGLGLKTESPDWDPCSWAHSSLQKGSQKHMPLPKVPVGAPHLGDNSRDS